MKHRQNIHTNEIKHEIKSILLLILPIMNHKHNIQSNMYMYLSTLVAWPGIQFFSDSVGSTEINVHNCWMYWEGEALVRYEVILNI